MKVDVVAQGLRPETQRLQPWRYISEIAIGLARLGHDVEFLTDTAGVELEQGRVPVLLPGPRGWDRAGLGDHLGGRAADVVLWNVGTTSALPTRSMVAGSAEHVAVFTSPLVRPRDLWRVADDVLAHPRSYAALAAGSLVPRSFLARHLDRTFGKIVTLSRTTARALASAGVPEAKLSLVPPGREAELPPDSPGPDLRQPALFAFAGSPASIRGADLLIRALALGGSRLDGARVLVLSREERASLTPRTAGLRRLAARLGVSDRVEVVGGVLPRARLMQELGRADAIVLPFRLVPSEAPLAVLEAASLGKLLIGSDLPAISDLAAPGSILVEPGNESALMRAFESVVGNRSAAMSAGVHAQRWWRTRPSWRDVAREFEGIAETREASRPPISGVRNGDAIGAAR